MKICISIFKKQWIFQLAILVFGSVGLRIPSQSVCCDIIDVDHPSPKNVPQVKNLISIPFGHGKIHLSKRTQDIPGASGTNPKRKGIPNHKGLVEGLGYVPFGVCCLRRTWVGLLVWEANIRNPGSKFNTRAGYPNHNAE